MAAADREMDALLFLLCLPLPQGDAPAETAPPDEVRGLVTHEPGAFEGYTLFSPLSSKETYLVDMDGEVVHCWQTDLNPGNVAYLLEDGSLLRCGRVPGNQVMRGGGQGGRIQRFSWEGELLWDYELSNAEQLQHHDIEPLPGGNILVLVWEARTPEAARAAGRDPAVLGPDGLWPDAVLELEPRGENGARVVWEWHSWDHLVQDLDPEASSFGSPAEHPGRIDINGDHRVARPLSAAERAHERERREQMRALGYLGDDDRDASDDERDRRRRGDADWLHTNSVDYLPEHDLILLSVRKLSEVWIIDHSTTTLEAAGDTGGRRGRGGELLYRWGNPRVHGAGDDGDRRLFGQHDARFVPGGGPGLHVLVFNNGEERPDGRYSTVDEIRVPFDPETGFSSGEDGAFGPREPVWSYAAPDRESFYSSFISGADRLPNGNTLVCSGVQGRVFEVTPAGEIVWDYLNPFGMDPPARPPEVQRADEQARRGHAGPGRGPNANLARGLFRAERIPYDHPAFEKL